jgi:hypothetical protein
MFSWHVLLSCHALFFVRVLWVEGFQVDGEQIEQGEMQKLKQ